MPKTGGEGRQKKLHVRTSLYPIPSACGRRTCAASHEAAADGELRVAAPNSRKDAQSAEAGVYRRVAEAFMLPRLEKGPVRLIPSSRRGQILPEDLDNIDSHRNKPGLVELCSADGDHTTVEIDVSQT